MKQKILHIIVTLLCIAALIRISVRCYNCYFSMQNVTLLRKITMGLATLGWFVIFGGGTYQQARHKLVDTQQ